MTIPLLYRIFHLYIEPLVLIPGGIYLALFQPSQFIYSTTPLPVSSPYAPSTLLKATSTPSHLTLFLLYNTASLYCMFGLAELLVLGAAEKLSAKDQVSVWRALLSALLVCDFGHLAALGKVMGPSAVVDWREWRGEDWTNIVILVAGIALRSCFLLGVGMGGRGRGKGKRS
jgi:hypothetical protein